MSRVLVACEFSGIVRDAFNAAFKSPTCVAWSCDLLPSESPGDHIVGDVRDHLLGWDLLIAFPPCTHLAVSGARWFSEKRKEQWRALWFVAQLASIPGPANCH